MAGGRDQEKRLEGSTPSGARVKLSNQLPLKVPFLVQIFPVYACNFKCSYCLYALPKANRENISSATYMDMDMYRKCIDSIKRLGKKIKMLRFAGIGEPLLHTNLSDMIQYAKKMDVAESIDLVTNGSLLSKELTHKLINAGLDRLRVSIQGVNDEKYQEIAQTKVCVQELSEKIEYFYKNKKSTEVYVKIIDCALNEPEDEIEFYRLFENKCDKIAIEHMTPTVVGIDYDLISNVVNESVTQNGGSILESKICPQPFYMMQINPDGKVVPCCSMTFPIVVGDAKSEGIDEVWNGKVFNEFRRSMLDGTSNAGEVCNSCVLYKYGMFEEDVLDEFAENLKGVY